ncbi:hypothetical protein H2198_003737 [Neophaeococcomyces mojaviensis]|uniref:Uncharacterized protein n=1 Tax=Neophaeococcomyces mojaviensis TaxID=3383035 RepID=A0ACC3AAR4_9EURO|nr:hypothetical protein H2198_003737 [Knufia sp. JES_112]
MAPTFLIVGATGNTGRGVVEALPKLLEASEVFSTYRVLALTRSKDSDVAQKLAKMPGVEVAEQNWTEITVDWLRENEVVRAFIASHNQPNQFAEESTFHINALNAGVEYVVRISTTAANVRPDCRAYYPRSHWAIEAMLSSQEFKALKWSSLQANGFLPLFLGSAVEYIKEYRKTGKIGKFATILSADAPVGLIDPIEVGVFAAHLLAQADITRHNNAKYVLNGPEDISGQQVVRLIEENIGAKVEDVEFKDMSMIDWMAANTKESKNVTLTIKHALDTVYAGECSVSTTSKEVLEIAPPKRTPAQVVRTMLEG